MINVSESVLTACNSDSVTFIEYIIIDGQKVIIKANLSDECYYDGHFIGTFIMKKLEFETENNIDYKQKEFVYYRQVNDESFKIGSFIVTDISNNDTKETVKVTAYDYGVKFANPYITELDYQGGKVTLAQVLQEVCTKVGVPLENERFENDTFIVDSNQFSENAQYGDVVKSVAQMSGNFAKINQNNKLELIFTKETAEIIEDYEGLEDKKDTRPITIVTLGMTDVEGENVTLRWEEGIKIYGENYLVINDNPFAYTEAKRIQLIQAIFNKVKGFGYSSFESKYTFKPYLQCGDLIQFKNKEGQLVNSIILKINTEHENITLSAPSVTDATVAYEQPLDAIQTAKRTEYIVNKQEQKITQTIEEVQEYNTRLTNVETGLDGIKQEVSNIATYKRDVEGTTEIHLTEAGATEILNLEIQGNKTYESNLFPGENLYPSEELYPNQEVL